MPKNLPASRNEASAESGGCPLQRRMPQNIRINAKTREFVARAVLALDRVELAGRTPVEYAERILRHGPKKALFLLGQLERMAFSVGDSERIEFFGSAKREAASKILLSGLSHLERSGFPEAKFQDWKNWILLRAATDPAAFDFWISWESRFELERAVFQSRGTPIDFVL